MDRKTIEVDLEMWQEKRRAIVRLQHENERLEEQLKMPVATGTEAAVCADITRRQQFGLAKYGVTVADNKLPLRAWLQHAYEETLDKAVYLKRAIEEIDKGSTSDDKS